MELRKLSERAVEIKDMYSQMEMEKFGKEWTNSQIMEAFVGDVGDLMKLVMAKEGIREIEDVDEKLSHELADCLYCVFLLSQRYDIDIEKTFLKTMDELEERLENYKN